MTIIDANGTHYRPEGTTRRIIRNLAILTFALILAILASAAVIGLANPSARTIIHTQNDTDSFNDGWNTGLSDIQDIGNSPAGKAKILNCLSAGGTATAFHTCLDR